MKQRIRIKQYKKALSKEIDFVINSFEYNVTHFLIDNNTTIKIWHEYLQDLENLGHILKNKQIHIIKKLLNDYEFVNTFEKLLDNIDAVYEVFFDDNEVTNYSNLLRKPIFKSAKQNKRKQYKKHLNHLLSFYRKKINDISNTFAYRELMLDIENINKLIQQNRIKELNSILEDMPFNAFVEDLINWYLYDFDDKYNLVVYDYALHKIK